jgi:hypothetical protein
MDDVRFEVFTAVVMKIASYEMLRRVAIVRTDVSEEIGASIIRLTRIGEIETTLAVTINRRTMRSNTMACNLRTLRRTTKSCHKFFVLLRSMRRCKLGYRCS